MQFGYPLYLNYGVFQPHQHSPFYPYRSWGCDAWHTMPCAPTEDGEVRHLTGCECSIAHRYPEIYDGCAAGSDNDAEVGQCVRHHSMFR